MGRSNLNRLPTLALSFNDLASVRSIIRAYITYTRRVSKPTQERDETLQDVERMREILKQMR